MNWIRSSKGATFGVLLLVALAAVGTASALTVEITQPDPAEVGDSIEYNATIEEPFRDAPEQWTLRGETDLGNATWTVQEIAQGETQTTSDYSGASFTHDLSDQTVTEVEVTVNGDVDSVGQFDYEDYAGENFTVMTLGRVTDGNMNEFDGMPIVGQRYTEESRAARTAIDEAIEAVGSRNDKIEQAISSYNTGNFENAQSLAEEAQSGAQSGQLLLLGVGALVVVAVVGGGVYYWRQQRDKGYKLQ